MFQLPFNRGSYSWRSDSYDPSTSLRWPCIALPLEVTVVIILPCLTANYGIIGILGWTFFLPFALIQVLWCSNFWYLLGLPYAQLYLVGKPNFENLSCTRSHTFSGTLKTHTHLILSFYPWRDVEFIGFDSICKILKLGTE